MSLLGVYARFLEESNRSVNTNEELTFITVVASTKGEALFDAINDGLVLAINIQFFKLSPSMVHQ